ncbi:hypothetical protein HY932_02285 [Candidatus Falkowbacteria bacterium]|nr:hypothetical protein [Candidatus Falkowbacteria bacterium]
MLNQQGNVLVYTVLAVAAILSTILIVSNLMIGEIRQAGNFDNMIKASYAAESGAEWGIFSLRKNDVMLENDCEMSGVECYVEADETGVKKLQTDLPQNQTLQIDLYNPIKLSNPASVESMKLGWFGAGPAGGGAGWVEVTLVEWPAGAQVVWDDNAMQKFLFNAPAVVNIFNKSKNYIVRLKALNVGITGLNVEIFSGDNAGGNELAFPQFVRIAAEGSAAGVTQKLNVDLLKKSPLMGLFDYTLFSEGDIEK